MPRKMIFTSESVTEGHPDKLCDRIADSCLDALIAGDPLARVACEVVAFPGNVHIFGEVTGRSSVDYEAVARDVIRKTGYTDDASAFSADGCSVHVHMNRQSPDIALGVDRCLEAKNGEGDGMDTGAGDQGMMFGFACDETPELMPLPISLAHKLAARLASVRRSGVLAYLRPDGKTQVSVEYLDGKPLRVDTVLISTQHAPDVSLETIRADLVREVITPVIPQAFFDERTKVLVNPTGRFVIGGPEGDSGLTGRKIIVDTYGGYARHGGGAFSGKDPTKVDRSAAYAARHLAKNIVACKAARKCEVQIAYGIGIARPVSVLIDTFGTGVCDDERIAKAVLDLVDLRPAAIISRLGLRRPIYAPHAAYGQMGREDLASPWEERDLAAGFARALGL